MESCECAGKLKEKIIELLKQLIKGTFGTELDYGAFEIGIK